MFDLSAISISLAILAARRGLPISSYLATDWFAQWDKDDWARVWPKKAGGSRVLRGLARRFSLVPPTGPPAFGLGHAIFANQFLCDLARRLEMPLQTAQVVPWGVDVCRYPFRAAPLTGPWRILVTGELRAEKRFDLAIEALARLERDRDRDGRGFTLTILGRESSSSLWEGPRLDHLRALSVELGVADRVKIAPAVARDQMPAVYAGHDLYFRGDVEQGAASLALLEAMSSGLAVVARRTWGNSTLLGEGKNALLFDRADAGECAHQLSRLATEPAFFEALRETARAAVERDHRLEDTAAKIECVLERAMRNSTRASLGGAAQRGATSAERIAPLDPDLALRSALDDLDRRVRAALRWATLMVKARRLTRPAVFLPRVRRAAYKIAAIGSFVACPVVLKAAFRLAGRPTRNDGDRGTLRARSVLVVQPADMGDVLLTAPFLRELRRALPDAWIGLAVQSSMIPLARHCPYVDELVPFTWRSFPNCGFAFQGHPRWWLHAARLSRKTLWKRRIDLAISVRWNDDATQAAAITLMFASGAPRRVGYVGRRDRAMPLAAFDRLLEGGPTRRELEHEVEMQLNLLSWLGVRVSDTRLEVWTSPEDEEFAARILREAGIGEHESLAAIAPGARWEMRRWPADRFAAIGRRLQEERGMRVVLFASEGERPLAECVAAGLRADRTLNLAGQTTIPQMAAVLRRCRLFVGNDSGPLHLAESAGVATVGIYGTGEFERFRPWGPNHRPVTLGLSCSPCSENCLFNDPRCVRGIPVEMVWEAVADLCGTEP